MMLVVAVEEENDKTALCRRWLLARIDNRGGGRGIETDKTKENDDEAEELEHRLHRKNS